MAKDDDDKLRKIREKIENKRIRREAREEAERARLYKLTVSRMKRVKPKPKPKNGK